MSQADDPTDAPADGALTQGPYALSGAVDKPDPRSVPLRGDLAHIALAGKYFVPHYAVPQPRTVMPGGAPLLAADEDGGEELCSLMEGDSFEVLDIAGAWAWGCLSVDGPVGYVQLDRLEPLS
ncbi:SH3 domain-containing protein [Aurantiacibacter aquimixticola]|uniref:SH3 domain-containing protein n=1 Tax=Aurantiacibacter aquimixticola TaxID=1958945 RepID=UPI001F5BBF9C|nr:SH3 domain-containing protein [Aurantiacibacter aquimixticola]